MDAAFLESFRRRWNYREHLETRALREPGALDAEKSACKKSVARFFSQWVWTYDPRRPIKSLPFDPFPHQDGFLTWLEERERKQENGLAEKSRDQGATCLCAGFALHHWLFHPGSSIGFGSRQLALVDEKGNPDAIFEKLRSMLYALPTWFLPRGFVASKHDKIGLLLNPQTGATIKGQGGDNIGRGGRCTLYFLDEAAFLERPELAYRALAGNTDVLIQVSTPNGPGNPFARERFSGRTPVYTLHYRDDPRKTPEWVAKKRASLDPITWAQEYEIDYNASIEGICIPAAWVEAAVNLLPPAEHAHGPIIAGFDVAEEGNDRSILIGRQGPIVLEPIDLGKANTTEMAWRARDRAKELGATEVIYDVGGPGLGIKGTWDTAPAESVPFLVTAVPFGGTPTENVWADFDGKKACEIFDDRRTEMWWSLRRRFERAYEYKTQGKNHKPDEMISIPNCRQLIAELSLPLKEHTDKGKIKLESKKKLKKRGVKSPDYADALALAFHVGTAKRRFQVW